MSIPGKLETVLSQNPLYEKVAGSSIAPPISCTSAAEGISPSRSKALELEAPGGSEHTLPVRFNRPGVSVSGAEMAGLNLRVRFPAGDGYRRVSVAFTW
jgi:hypothetical protein